MSVFLLEAYVQNYDWGKLGQSSVVSQLVREGYSLPIVESAPYAELWMGDHVNGPCSVFLDSSTKVSISDFLKTRSKIKFLFKVLSVRKSLSIQSHPDEALAQKLHSTYPKIYKDPNPKPELAIALTPFRALFGFRPITQILDFLIELEALHRVIPQHLIDNLKHSQTHSSLKEVYSALMRAPAHLVEKTITELLEIESSSVSLESLKAITLARDLDSQFPGGDVGVLSVFLLNIVDLQPGESLFMGANVPHAYISGDLIECMTSSDNVIRGGLTPKFKDIETLISSLEYSSNLPRLLEPKIVEGGFPCWSPPDVPFAVTKFTVPDENKTRRITSSSAGPSIAIVMGGSGKIDHLCVKKGQSVLILPNQSVTVQAGQEGLEMYIAFTP